MPIDLPVRKTLNPNVGLHRLLEEWGAVLAMLCFAVALIGLVSQTPRSARAGLSASIYEAMMQSP